MLPDVPTTAELDLPDVRMETWFGVIAPSDLPAPILERLAQAIDAVLQDTAFRDKLFAIGCATAFMPPAEFALYISSETRRWSQIIPAMGIAIQD
jgi:tripartite-type tricarboxylate transporter receptor subunit TctC